MSQATLARAANEIPAMTAPAPQPLWKEVLGDAEPRRRGREAVIVVTIVILLGEAVRILAALASGHMPSFFLQVFIGWVIAMLLYFVWIGQTWARWLLAPIFALNGCWDFIWGIVGSDGLRLVIGVGELIIFTYLAISPSVYVFARHQRERISRWQVLAISGVFLATFVSIGSAILAFFIYQNTLKAEATEFTRLTFHRVFENRDPIYLAEHSSKTRKNSSPRQFINRIDAELGEVKSMGPLGMSFRTKFVPYRLELRGTATARVVFESGAHWVTIEISGPDPDWEIDHMRWDY
jgi:hypothetical protein